MRLNRVLYTSSSMRVRAGSVHTHSVNACSTVWRFWYSNAVACASLTLFFPVGSSGSGLVRLLVVALSAPDTTSNGLRPASDAQTVFADGLLVEFRGERRVDLPVAGRLVMTDRKASHTAVGDVGLGFESERFNHEVPDHAGRDPR